MRTELTRQLSQLEAELEDLYTMSEEAACILYNVDNKEEAITILQECIDDVMRDIEDSAPVAWGMIDPAFASLTDYYRMRI